MLAIWLIPSLVSEALTDATPLRHAALFSTGKRVRPWMRAGLGEILGELLRRLNGFSCPLSGKGNDSRRLERHGRGWGAAASLRRAVLQKSQLGGLACRRDKAQVGGPTSGLSHRSCVLTYGPGAAVEGR